MSLNLIIQLVAGLAGIRACLQRGLQKSALDIASGTLPVEPGTRAFRKKIFFKLRLSFRAVLGSQDK